MQGFYDNLGDTSWWMSVVFVGLGLNLLAAYLKWPIDTIMSKLFTSWTRRLEAQNQFRAQLLEKAVEDSPLQLLMAIELLRLKVKILYSMFLGIVFLSMASSFSPELSPEGAP
ncbi:MAG: hypothetical protein Q8S75_01705, partial [Nitrospirota bacterium]|nr:hypothetical protein [Nitrospirota bacterium]